ncbi:uncharacterized protein LOC120997770 [Bufo bufo]|uniref:uncharacterized protein LOC120997770 n=1 Tax=Bufo bufo TaxID=8384 RepID=UPI001ABDAB25|nr:uncharacterized protein LOC120997770 [Bufo bufo]
MDMRPTVDNLMDEEEAQPGASDNPEIPIETSMSQPQTSNNEEAGPSTQVEVSTSPHVNPRSARPKKSQSQPAPVSITREIIDAQVLEYLNKTRDETPEDGMMKSLGNYLTRVPRERQPHCMCSMNLLLELYMGENDPSEVHEYLEQARSRLIQKTNLSQATSMSSNYPPPTNYQYQNPPPTRHGQEYFAHDPRPNYSAQRPHQHEQVAVRP